MKLPGALTRFEAVVSEERPLTALGDLGEPTFLGFLFAVEVRRLVRMGPATDPSGRLTPAHLLTLAQRAAAGGRVPASTPGEVRRLLRQAVDTVRGAGAWRIDRPLWWQPLPAADELEELWGSLDALLDDPVEIPGAPQALGSGGWLPIPALLPAAFCRALHRELEAADAAGALGLQAGTVGAGAEISASRSDEVRCLDGLEAKLLARLPRLAVLVQWSLGRLIPRLAAGLPGRSLHPPRTAMLARYPGLSGGFRPHLDNPGGEADNGRALSVVLYLNGGEPCAGGELALWRPGADPAAPPDAVLPPRGGSAVAFDSRAVPHQVRPLGPGPARWSLAIWLNEASQHDFERPPLPALSATDVLLPVAAPPLPRDTVLWHQLEDDDPAGTIVVGRSGSRVQRAGIVSTVYGAGAGLDRWCRHHFVRGFDHLVLVFDHLDEAAEAAAAERLRRTYPASRLTVWSSAELAVERWPRLAAETGLGPLLPFARQGASPQAVASRQTLNATAALHAAKTGELEGAPLDWLLHLDADELFDFPGPGRGGADAGEHFAALSAAGVELARYVNHELLLPASSSAQGASRPRFKRHPRLAAARLGPAGWARLAAALGMRQTDRRPYFNGYLNGKSAVAVAAGVAAAGVHGWTVSGAASRFLAGPAVLHFHFASADGYWRKYLAMAKTAEGDEVGLFEPCRTELTALELVRSLRRSRTDEETIRQRLLALRDEVAGFTAAEVEILEEAGLIFEPS